MLDIEPLFTCGMMKKNNRSKDVSLMCASLCTGTMNNTIMTTRSLAKCYKNCLMTYMIKKRDTTGSYCPLSLLFFFSNSAGHFTFSPPPPFFFSRNLHFIYTLEREREHTHFILETSTYIYPQALPYDTVTQLTLF